MKTLANWKPLPLAARAGVWLLLLGVLFSCASSPEGSPHRGVDLVEVSLQWREPPAYITPELPEPFIRVVDLGRLRVGMTKAQVLEMFPDPQEVRTTRADTEFWAYRFAELQFRNGRLENWFTIR